MSVLSQSFILQAVSASTNEEIAALRAVNAELVAALEQIVARDWYQQSEAGVIARAALAKVQS